MKNLIIRIIAILLYTQPVLAQAGAAYRDFVVSRGAVWALTPGGDIRLFDATTGKPLQQKVAPGEKVTCITKDKNDNIIIADSRRQVRRYDAHSGTWATIAHCDAKPLGIVVNSRGACFAITTTGIRDLATQENYYTGKSLNNQFHRIGDYWEPYCFYLDRNDILWLGFGYGEWGGNLIAFHTTQKKFLDLSPGGFDVALWPIKSFFEDNTATYITAGLEHIRTSGAIAKVVDMKASIIFNSESHWSDTSRQNTARKWINGEYIGPGACDPAQRYLYFYSQNGFFRGDKTKDLSRIENWQHLASPTLSWKQGQPDAVGSPMNVLKLCVTGSDRFIFLSQNNGLALFDGQKVITLKE